MGIGCLVVCVDPQRKEKKVALPNEAVWSAAAPSRKKEDVTPAVSVAMVTANMTANLHWPNEKDRANTAVVRLQVD